MSGAPMMLTAAMIAAATGGTVAAGDPQTVIDGFSIDSRTLQPGDLFFAIVAERDGHEFVANALALGASGAVVSSTANGALAALRSEAEGSAPPVVIRVPDTTHALQDLGYTNVAHLTVGFNGWADAGGAVEPVEPDPKYFRSSSS